MVKKKEDIFTELPTQVFTVQRQSVTQKVFKSAGIICYLLGLFVGLSNNSDSENDQCLLKCRIDLNASCYTLYERQLTSI